jgi:hypothetical protein
MTIAGAVPCSIPYRGITLLQLIEHSSIEGSGFFRRKHVLANPGTRRDTLITYVERFDSDHREELDFGVQVELERIVSHAMTNDSFELFPMNVTVLDVMKVGINASIALDGDLANAGFKATSDNSWSLSFGNGVIEKKSVAMCDLTSVLSEKCIEWKSVMTYFKGVVTAIYYVTGGLTYTGASEFVTTGGVQLTTTRAPVEITAGWQYIVCTTGQVALSEINPRDRIIAIEYRELKPGVRDKGPGNPRRFVMLKQKRRFFTPDRR